MTKKDYELIAEVLRDLQVRIKTTDVNEHNVVEWLANEFAYHLKEDNDNFDNQKFTDAVYNKLK